MQSKLSSGLLTAGLLALFALLGAVTLASCGDNGDPTSPPGGNPHPLEIWTEISPKPFNTSDSIYAIAYGGTAEPKKLPGRRTEQLAMAHTWAIVLSGQKTAWNVPVAECLKLENLLMTADEALEALMDKSSRTHVASIAFTPCHAERNF